MTQPKPLKVIKVGGNQFAHDGFLDALADAVKQQQKHHACILVHGGGRAVSEHLEQLHIQPRFVHGQRVTDVRTLQVAEMVLSGKMNKDIVHALNRIGLDALGLSGVDRNLLWVEPWNEDMGWVGKIVKVRSSILSDLCAQDVIPVISPISAGEKGKYNVNADHAAARISGALNAPELVLVSNVPGVLVRGEVRPQLSEQEALSLIETHDIRDGMIPKVRACIDALHNGAGLARITDLAGLPASTGTHITKN